MANGLGHVTSRAVVSEPSGRVAVPGTATRLALELVAVRGRDVIGIRHLLDGGRATIGAAVDAIAHAPVREWGGESLVIADVSGDRRVLRLPRGARGRLHAKEGLPRLLTGPVEVPLAEGDRAVLVLGPVQVRAQIVPIEIFSRAAAPHAARWIGLVGALYVAALALCAALAPRDRVHLDEGSLQRAVAAATAQAGLSAGDPVMKGVER